MNTTTTPVPARCAICGWPLKATIEEGCTAESCSYRPEQYSEEWHRIQRRKAELARGPAERKPVAGWEIGHVPGYSARRAAPILRRGPICVRAGEASWEMIAESDEDDVESIQITRWPAANTLAAQLAAEDALFAIADAINALRGGR